MPAFTPHVCCLQVFLMLMGADVLALLFLSRLVLLEVQRMLNRRRQDRDPDPVYQSINT